ncbi:cyclin-dependent kinase inhibitor 1 [Camelus ferus]|nr:cyclin-dependent kinase inhibitor 1 [Camelus ferus]
MSRGRRSRAGALWAERLGPPPETESFYTGSTGRRQLRCEQLPKASEVVTHGDKKTPGNGLAAATMSEPSRDAHQIPRSSKACRRLFGPVDSEQLSRDCDALMASCVQEARDRWNFDFVTETPLEGPRGAWDDLGGGKWPSTSPALLQGTSQEDHVDLSLSCTLVPRSPERPEESPGGPGTSQGRKRRQTSMTDFYHSKRRLIFSKRKP